MTASKPFVIARVLDAPRDLVWQCFTQAERLKLWWGPKGFEVVHARLDFRVGGIFHYGLVAPDGSPMWGRFVYREIVPQQRIEFISSFSDEAGGLARHVYHSEWPLEMLTAFIFDELPDRKTRLTVQSASHEASAAERAMFDANHASMTGGWGGTLDQLGAYLTYAKSETNK